MNHHRTGGRQNMKKLGKFLLLFSINYFIIVFQREAIKEDESGRIQSSVDDIVYRAIRKKTLQKKNIRLGMV